MGSVGNPVFEVASDLAPESEELGWMEDLIKTGCRVTYACVQNDLDPKQWKRLLSPADRFPGKVFPKVAIRPPGVRESAFGGLFSLIFGIQKETNYADYTRWDKFLDKHG